MGAQAFSSFDTLLAPFVKKDNLSYKEVKQCIQSFVYGVNTPSRWGCVPETYRVLTTDGWKGIDSLKAGDVLYTWRNGKLATAVNNATIIKEYDGDLVCFENKHYGYKQEVTDYHRTLVCKTNKSLEEAVIEQAGDIYNEKYKYNFTMPVSFTGCIAHEGIDLTDNEITLAAMMYTDGSFDWRGDSIHKVTYFKSVERSKYFSPQVVFDALGFKVEPSLYYTEMSHAGVMKWVFYGDDARRIVEIVGRKEIIHERFARMNQHQAKLFLDIWCLHDGDEERMKAQCDNWAIVEALEYINVLAGNVSAYKGKMLNSGHTVNYVKTIQVDKIHFDCYKKRYKGRVWCPNNNDGTAIFMNDRGGVFISGQTQSPFSNITLDWNCPADLKDQPAIVGGVEQDFTYGDCKAEMDMVNKAFMEIMNEGDYDGKLFSYPIPTYSITKDFDWSESENLKLLFGMAAKYGIPYFSNYINSDMNPSDVRSMCCRLRLDLREIIKKKGGGFFGSGDKTGSTGVVTLNFPKLAYLSKDKEDFYKRLDNLMDIAARSLAIKRETVTRLMENGLYPYTKRYIGSFDTYFNTIATVGMNEMCLNAKWIQKNIASKEGQEFTIEVLHHILDRLPKYQQEYGYLFNLESAPAESTCYRLAKHDKEKYPDIKTAGTDKVPYYTNSSNLPVGYTANLYEALEHQDPIQTLYTSGTVFHIYLGEKLPDWKAAATIIKKVCENYRLPYITLSPTFSVCPEHGYIPGEHTTCPICKSKHDDNMI